MEAEEGKGRQQRRSYTAEYKADVVAMCLKGERSVRAIARDLGLDHSMVNSWVVRTEKQAEIDAGKREGLTTSEREELRQLRKENRILREERDILRRATAFFARETR